MSSKKRQRLLKQQGRSHTSRKNKERGREREMTDVNKFNINIEKEFDFDLDIKSILDTKNNLDKNFSKDYLLNYFTPLII